jgi:WD40 repeat protein
VNGEVAALDLSVDGKRLAVAGPDDAVRLYDVNSRTLLGTEIAGYSAATLRDDGLELAALSAVDS